MARARKPHYDIDAIQYELGYSAVSLAKKRGVSRQAMCKALKRRNVVMRDHTCREVIGKCSTS